MRSLESIFGGDRNEKERVVLFEDGKWCIYRRIEDRHYIIHRCDKANKASNQTDKRCHACSATMPVALKGLFILNEWSR